MPQTPTTLLDELFGAARGVAAIVTGNRRAPGYFDFSPRGLAGSFIALLLATAISAYLPSATPDSGSYTSMPPPRLILVAAFLFAVQLGFSALMLRQVKRLDALVPYLVADNWATFFITLASTVLALFGLSSDAVVIVVGIMVLIVEINIARLVMTLGGWQIAMLLAVQLVGVAIGLLLLGLILPIPPDAAGAGL